MKSKIIIILFLLSSFSTFAQVPRTVLMEYATNASCPPCATYNPGMKSYLDNNYNRMVAIWYHTWWPGSGDPMYLANTGENRNRILYYGVQSVPSYIIDGTSQGYGNELSKMKSQADTRYALTSPVKLTVNKKIVGDSLDVTVTLVVYGDVTQDNLKLQTVIIEQMVKYDRPPGSNGESKFARVFRKFIGGVAGIDIANLSIGDSLTFTMKDEIKPEWKRNEVAIVAFLQSHSSKEVIQAATDRKIHSISSETPEIELVSKNQNITHLHSITNHQDDSLKLLISLDVIDNTQNWNTTLKHNGNSVDSFEISLLPEESVNFELNILTNDAPDYLRLSISAKNIGGMSDYKDSLNYLAIVKAGDIMLIDDDGGKSFENNFVRILKNHAIEYTFIEHKILKEVQQKFDIPKDFKAIFWNMGNHSPSMESTDFSLIMNYLNNGGRVLFSGSDFAHDIYDVQNSSKGKFFFDRYLDVNYVTDSVMATTLSSVAGNPLFDTLNIQLNSQAPNYPDGVDSRTGKSKLAMKFDGTDYYGLILRETTKYKTAYLTFGLEQITSEVTQDLVVSKILTWFETPVGIDETPGTELTPTNYGLEQNYPNPFNPSTIINYQLPEAGNVKITVYDILGNKVANLVNENKNTGYHSVEFNASHLSSGLYFYSISVGSFHQVKKMLLLK